MRFLPVFSLFSLADPTKTKEEKRICLPAFKAPLAAIFKRLQDPRRGHYMSYT